MSAGLVMGLSNGAPLHATMRKNSIPQRQNSLDAARRQDHTRAPSHATPARGDQVDNRIDNREEPRRQMKILATRRQLNGLEPCARAHVGARASSRGGGMG